MELFPFADTEILPLFSRNAVSLFAHLQMGSCCLASFPGSHFLFLSSTRMCSKHIYDIYDKSAQAATSRHQEASFHACKMAQQAKAFAVKTDEP